MSIKKIYKIGSLLKKRLIKLITYRFLYWQKDVFRNYIDKYLENSFFIQIGANDGITDDIIFDKIINSSAKGILVEPIPYLFERLKKNYAKREDGLYFENVAIGKEISTLPFYRISNEESESKKWHEGLGSFRLDVLEKHKNVIPFFDKRLITEHIALVPFDYLLNKYSIKKVNFLIIDTEGYEAEIILSIDFKKCDIDLVIYEDKHLKKEERKKLLNFLVENNYAVKKLTDFDMAAVKKSILKDVYF